MASTAPTFIYKLVPHTSPVPQPLPDALPVSELDRSSGFIHLSTAPQVLNTLKWFFASDPSVTVLRIRYAPLEDAKLIKWEDAKAEVCGPRGGEGMFPHLYNELVLGSGNVESVRVWEKGEGIEGEGWEGVVRAQEEEGWLVY